MWAQLQARGEGWIGGVMLRKYIICHPGLPLNLRREKAREVEKEREKHSSI